MLLPANDQDGKVLAEFGFLVDSPSAASIPLTEEVCESAVNLGSLGRFAALG